MRTFPQVLRELRSRIGLALEGMKARCPHCFGPAYMVSWAVEGGHGYQFHCPRCGFNGPEGRCIRRACT